MVHPAVPDVDVVSSVVVAVDAVVAGPAGTAVVGVATDGRRLDVGGAPVVELVATFPPPPHAATATPSATAARKHEVPMPARLAARPVCHQPRPER